MAGAGLAWKVIGTGATVVAGVAARKVATTTWKVTTGKEPPANPEDPDVTWQEAAAWAVLSGIVVGLARLVATKKSAQFWKRSTGKLPPNMEKVTA